MPRKLARYGCVDEPERRHDARRTKTRCDFAEVLSTGTSMQRLSAIPTYELFATRTVDEQVAPVVHAGDVGAELPGQGRMSTFLSAGRTERRTDAPCPIPGDRR